MITHLTTGFSLTKFTLDHEEQYYQISNNENVMRFVTGYALDREASKRMLQRFVYYNSRHPEFGRFLVESRSGEVIGAAKIEFHNSKEIEIGYRIVEEHWGKGIATEIGNYLIHFGKKMYPQHEIIALVDTRNAASIRVLEKLGMQKVKSFIEGKRTCYKYKLLTSGRPSPMSTERM